MALKEPYCDIPCADTYLVDSEDWNAATDSEKNNALFWGRTYIDTYFKCPALVADPDNPSDEVTYANALLAEDYIQGTLLSDTGSSSKQTVKKEKVSAQTGTNVETEYSSGVTTNPQQDVDALLYGQCTRSKANSSNYKVITNT